jgi:hypothetical protein
VEEHLLAKEAEENSVHQTTTQEEMMEENKNGIRAIHQKEEVALKTDLALRLQEIVLQEVEAEVDVVAMEELTTTETSSQDQALVAEEAQVEEVDNLHKNSIIQKTRSISRSCFFIILNNLNIYDAAVFFTDFSSSLILPYIFFIYGFF